MHIRKPSEELMAIPSLPRRDVIEQWRVACDKSALSGGALAGLWRLARRGRDDQGIRQALRDRAGHGTSLAPPLSSGGVPSAEPACRHRRGGRDDPGPNTGAVSSASPERHNWHAKPPTLQWGVFCFASAALSCPDSRATFPWCLPPPSISRSSLPDCRPASSLTRVMKEWAAYSNGAT